MARTVYDLDAMRTARDGWLADAEKDWQTDISTTTSQLSASGMRPGSLPWEQQLEGVEARYRDRLSEIEQTETVKIINREEQYIAEKKIADAEAAKQSIITGERSFIEGDTGSRQPEFLMNFATGEKQSRSLFTLGQLDSRVRRADLDKAAGIDSRLTGSDIADAPDIEGIRNLSDAEYLKREGFI